MAEQITKERLKELADYWSRAGMDTGKALRELLAYRESGALEALKNLLLENELANVPGSFVKQTAREAIAKLEAIER